MIALMATVLVAVVIVGTAALAGHPLYLIAAGTALACAVLLLSRRMKEERR